MTLSASRAGPSDVADSAGESYAHGPVPEAEQGSGWRIFFIVAGTQCGLPSYILGADLALGQGLANTATIAVIGGLILALLGGVGAWVGSRSRMSLPMLADRAFGTRGAHLVKLMIALSLLGWFAATISVLAATASSVLGTLTGRAVPTMAIAIPFGLVVGIIAGRGARGLEKLGMVIVPLALITIMVAVSGTLDTVPQTLGQLFAKPGDAHMGFGGAVAAAVGVYIVGAMIQPDYGRFVRRPGQAAAGTAAALALVFPVLLVASALPAMALGKPDLISALAALGLGIPALVVLLTGACIDASACLYSGALSLANEFPRLHFRHVVAVSAVVGIGLSLAGAEVLFVPFLVALGIALPPMAAVQIAAALGDPGASVVSLRPGAFVAWGAGLAIGLGETWWGHALSGLATIDSIVVAGLIGWITLRRR